jgi:hypothetical protein
MNMKVLVYDTDVCMEILGHGEGVVFSGPIELGWWILKYFYIDV